MAKFKINQKVALREGSNYEVVNEIGVIKAREVRQVGNKTEVRYLVDFGGGLENWLILTRKDLKSATEIVNKEIFKIKTYKLDKGMILTLASCVFKYYDYVYDSDNESTNKKYWKILSIGFSIYNGVDEYDEKIGNKIAIHRCKENPFTTMISDFSGEFNEETVFSIMDQKANYISNNIDKFYRPN